MGQQLRCRRAAGGIIAALSTGGSWASLPRHTEGGRGAPSPSGVTLLAFIFSLMGHFKSPSQMGSLRKPGRFRKKGLFLQFLLCLQQVLGSKE